MTALGDKDLFDAIFLSSFIMFYALGEDILVEDLAERLFKFRTLCYRILAGEIQPGEHMKELYLKKGRGKEFENLIARKFDEMMAKLEEAESRRGESSCIRLSKFPQR